MSAEMFRSLPWPYPGGVFPANLGVVLMRSVLAGAHALQVVHFPDDGGWGINDSGDPNAPDGQRHAHAPCSRPGPTLAELASLAPSHAADRQRVGSP